MRSIVPTLLIALLTSSTVFAEWKPYIDEAEPPVPSSVRDKEPWKEGVTILPPFPKDGDLVEFSVDDPSSQFRQYIDGKHLTTGTDEVVRYTLVVESSTGARNVSFEGMRCTPKGAYKIYAYGYDGRFEKTQADWVSIYGRLNDKIHDELHKTILCIPRAFTPRPKKEMIRAMRVPQFQEVNTGFVSD